MNNSKTMTLSASALAMGVALLLAAPASGQTHYAEIDQEARFPDRFAEILQEIEDAGAVVVETATFHNRPKLPPGNFESLMFVTVDLSGGEDADAIIAELEAVDGVAEVMEAEAALEKVSDRNLVGERRFAPKETIPARVLHGLRLKGEARPATPTIDRNFRIRRQLVVFYLDPLPGDNPINLPAFDPEIVAIKEAFGLRKVRPQEGEIPTPYEEALEIEFFERDSPTLADNEGLMKAVLTILNQNSKVWSAAPRDIFPKPARIIPAVFPLPEDFFLVVPPFSPSSPLVFDDPVRLGNASLRSLVGSGERLAIGGFVIEGEGPRRVLLRGRGPSLVEFGIGNPVSDPLIRLFRGQDPVASNDDWTALPEAERAEIEGLGLSPAEDAEAAWIGDLEPGVYTAHLVESPEAEAPVADGVGVVEAFKAGEGEAARFANQSARAFVDAGERVAIMGLIVEGADPLRFALRARGPSLAEFGVAEPLEDPVVELFKGERLIATNDDWRAFDGEYTVIEGLLEDAGLAPGDDRESAIVAFLEPGAYTLVVRGADGASGVALAEAFALEGGLPPEEE